MSAVVPLEQVQTKIFWLRSQKVMFDFDLSELYGVETKALNQAVSRNIDRFPEDFMFRLNKEEYDLLIRSQIVTASNKKRNISALPRAFTQEGIAMLSGVLRSQKAIDVNIAIMRAFVRMREAMLSHQDMAKRLDDMEAKYDDQFAVVFDALRQLLEAPEPENNPIGYIKHR